MKIYYIPPTNKIFNEIKEKAIELWKEVDTDDDKYGYATSKINRIKDLKNIGDNFMTILAMFDAKNQMKLMIKLSKETQEAIRIRLLETLSV